MAIKMVGGQNNNISAFLVAAIFSSTVATVLATVYVLSRVGLEDLKAPLAVKTLLLSYFILFMPFSVRSLILKLNSSAGSSLYFSEAFMMLSAVAAVVMAGWMTATTGVNLYPLFGFVGLALFIINWIIYLRGSKLINVLIWIMTVVLFSGWIAGKVWGRGFQNSLYPESLAVYSNIDVLFHAAISSVIKTYGVPSIGLDGVIPINYHYGSHWIFAWMSQVLNLTPIDFYSLAFPVIFIPFLLINVLYFVIGLRKVYGRPLHDINPGGSLRNIIFYIVLMVGFVGILPRGILNHSGAFIELPFITESYSLGVAFSLNLATLLLTFYLKRYGDNKKLDHFSSGEIVFIVGLLPLLIVFLGFLKISTLFLALAALLWLFFRLGLFRERVFNISLVLLLLLYILYNLYFMSGRSDKYHFEMFHFIKHYVIGNSSFLWAFGFVAVNFFWSWAFILVRLSGVKDKSEWFKRRKFVDVEVLMILCIAGALPGLLGDTGNGSAFFFSDTQNWFGLGFFLAVPGSIIRFNGIINKTAISMLALTVMSSTVYNLFFDTMSYAADSLDLRLKMIQSTNYRPDTYENIQSFIDVIKKRQLVRMAEIPTRDLAVLIKGPEIALAENRRYELIKNLIALNGEPSDTRKKTLLFIPQSNKLYWGGWVGRTNLPYMAESMLAPALSGLAMEDGLPQFERSIDNTYGYSKYSKRTTEQTPLEASPESVFARVKNKGFDRVLIIRENRVDAVVDYTGIQAR